MKKKLFLIGFTVEGFEQTGGLDAVVNEEEDDDEELEEDNENNQEGKDDGTQDDILSNDENAIDDLDKANLGSKRTSDADNYKNASDAINHQVDWSDSEHENFIMECAMEPKFVMEKETVEPIRDVNKFGACASPAVIEVEKSISPSKLGDGFMMNEHMASCEAKDPVAVAEEINPMDTGSSDDREGNLPGEDSVAYCNMVLKSIDCSDSEEEKNDEDDLTTLPMEAVDLIKCSGLKRGTLAMIEGPGLNEPHKHRIIKAEDGHVGLFVLTEYSIQMWQMKVNYQGVTTWLLRNAAIHGISPRVKIKKTRLLGYDEDTEAIVLNMRGGVYMVELKSMQCKKLHEVTNYASCRYYPFKSFRPPGDCSSLGLILYVYDLVTSYT
ncbi:hypothetical protein VPH35_048683 [Triticum aestivum]|uniref:Uncharacterized protein n=1 Tax=Triticum aestivum TaxID=4565 RepID=A0A077RZ44_WHEAT|nr:unnamed protein product [Triticum aestivum]